MPPPPPVIVPEYNGELGSGNLQFIVKNVKNLSKMKSPFIQIWGLSWGVEVLRQVNGEYLGIYIVCKHKTAEMVQMTSALRINYWCCHARVETKLLAWKEGVEPITKQLSVLYEKGGPANWGWRDFIAWNDVTDLEKGYMKNGTLEIFVHISVEEPVHLSDELKFSLLKVAVNILGKHGQSKRDIVKHNDNTKNGSMKTEENIANKCTENIIMVKKESDELEHIESSIRKLQGDVEEINNFIFSMYNNEKELTKDLCVLKKVLSDEVVKSKALAGTLNELLSHKTDLLNPIKQNLAELSQSYKTITKEHSDLQKIVLTKVDNFSLAFTWFAGVMSASIIMFLGSHFSF